MSQPRATAKYDFSPIDWDEYCVKFGQAARDGDVKRANKLLAVMKQAILFQPIPDTACRNDEAGLTVRGQIWKCFIRVHVDAKEYTELVSLGPTPRRQWNEPKGMPLYTKIRGDLFRTFAPDAEFGKRVGQQALSRVLNAFVHKYGESLSYVQGMNAIAGALLYIMPEVDAFYCFCKLVTQDIPLYWVKDTVGVTVGCALVAKIIAALDPELDAHLRKIGLQTYNSEVYSNIFAFSPVSSLSSSIPSFEELLQLWDFLIAFGLHFNIVFVAAEIIMMRQQLLAEDSGNGINKYLNYNKWPKHRSRPTISVAMGILPRIPPELYDEIRRHGHDKALAEQYVDRKVNFEPIKL